MTSSSSVAFITGCCCLFVCLFVLVVYRLHDVQQAGTRLLATQGSRFAGERRAPRSRPASQSHASPEIHLPCPICIPIPSLQTLALRNSTSSASPAHSTCNDASLPPPDPIDTATRESTLLSPSRPWRGRENCLPGLHAWRGPARNGPQPPQSLRTSHHRLLLQPRWSRSLCRDPSSRASRCRRWTLRSPRTCLRKNTNPSPKGPPCLARC